MINIPYRRCGSVNIRKNGLTEAGAQKYHCRACNFYGTPVTQEEKRGSYRKTSVRTRFTVRDRMCSPRQP
jgi:transposase-like protein